MTIPAIDTGYRDIITMNLSFLIIRLYFKRIPISKSMKRARPHPPLNRHQRNN